MSSNSFIPAEQKVSRSVRDELDQVSAEISETAEKLRGLALRRARLETTLAVLGEPAAVLAPAPGEDDETKRIAQIVSPSDQKEKKRA